MVQSSPQWAGPNPGGSHERIPLPARPNQRPPPVPGARRLGRGRHRHHGIAGCRRRRVRQQRTRARRRVPARRGRPDRPIPEPGWPVGPHRAPHRQRATRRRRPCSDRRADPDPARRRQRRRRRHRPLRLGIRRPQRRRPDRLPRRHLQPGQAHCCAPGRCQGSHRSGSCGRCAGRADRVTRPARAGHPEQRAHRCGCRHHRSARRLRLGGRHGTSRS